MCDADIVVSQSQIWTFQSTAKDLCFSVKWYGICTGWVVSTMTSKIFFVLGLLVTILMVFYLFNVTSCFAGSCNRRLGPSIPQLTRVPVFYNGYVCESNQTSNQNQHPRRTWSLQEYECEQLPAKLPIGVRCIPAEELRKYTWNTSNPKVIISRNKHGGGAVDDAHIEVGLIFDTSTMPSTWLYVLGH